MTVVDDPRRLVRAALDAIGAALPPADDAPLGIDSFTTVLLVEELEARLGRTIPARDVRRERFASIATVSSMIAELQ